MKNAQSSQKKEIKEKILSEIKDEELEEISFTDNKDNIFWEENEKEFLFLGEMYDVVKTKVANGKVILYCINDKIEKALIDKYNLITKHNSSSDKKAKSFIDYCFNLFVYDNVNNNDTYSVGTIPEFYSFDSYVLNNVLDTFSPPPEA